MKNTIYLSGLLSFILFSITACKEKPQKGEEKDIFYSFAANGEINRPTDYRTWVFAGTGTTPKSHDSTAIFPDFQNVYIDPVSYKFWKENGYYREGTIFVKELLRKGDTISPIGKGFYQGPHYSLSCTVKDSKRFPDMKGGWQYFKFTDYEKKKLNPTSPPLGESCVACHRNSKQGYGPFTEFYPVLLDAKAYGKENPEDRDTRTGLDDDMKNFKE
jgi:hypothetical protein